MSHSARAEETAYYEFPFAIFIGEVAEKERQIQETIFHETDDSANQQAQLAALYKLVSNANLTLDAQGYLGREVTYGSSLKHLTPDQLTKLGMISILDQALPEASDTLTAQPERSPLVATNYKGLSLLSESLSADMDLRRPAICHKLLLSAHTFETAYVEQSTKLYGYLPIDNDELQVLRPVPAYSPNERWLANISRQLLQSPGPEFDVQLAETVFQTILNAHQAYGDTAKNLDWYYDQLGEHTDLIGNNCSMRTGGYQVLSEGKSLYYADPITITGTVVSFGDMATFKKVGEETFEHSDERQLALIFEIEFEGQTCIARVPLGLCPPVNAES